MDSGVPEDADDWLRESLLLEIQSLCFFVFVHWYLLKMGDDSRVWRLVLKKRDQV
ncbi:hypothetical protein K469DRAFT_701498 [Zopfia rhizophila CBS 207.26]|uniref:Uncharacterized protein n=1 Tax=Zopfia rhizophila CBS 207.26 TaxID=1314779 RepID=A0A6A6D8J4_9PEZI|nr:hypothetical protein K469DRAFT_701498 [Zopfia rhizophila CBS 207.26]